jgi:hypothetical protein
MKLKGLQLATLVLYLTLGTGAQLTPAGPGLSVTGVSLEFHRVAVPSQDVIQQAPSQTTKLDDFISTVANGNPGQVVGVHSDEFFSLPVMQQPPNNPGYVSSQTGVVTQFAMASRGGSTGLLAHNTADGGLFYSLTEGQQITLVLGDGALQHYMVTDVRRFQALTPSSPNSNFRDLDASGPLLSSRQLFNQIYSTQSDQLVLQTCISMSGTPNWGRLFVIATPIEALQQASQSPLILN